MDQVRKLLRKFYLSCQTPLGDMAAKLVAEGEWAELQKLRCRDMSSYSDAYEYYLDAVVVDLMRKCQLPADDRMREERAFNDFIESEKLCAATNIRLRRFIADTGPFGGPGDLRIREFITLWRKEVKRVLGKVPYDLTPSFSGGSTLSDKGKLTTIPDKMSSSQTLYRDLLPDQVTMTKFTPFEDVPWVKVRSNAFFTQPKDAERFRGCCMEASLPMAFQLAIGKHLKTRYRIAYGIDLRYAKDLHTKLARQASKDGSMATIDLSKASDTLAKKLVELLLPADWFKLLCSLRASSTEYKGKHYILEKFSSMGNGFTFELETIIFRSLLAALGCPVAYVFGDDIIVSSHRVDSVVSALRYFGFQTNERKTFCEGPFRESCGGDYFEGTPVRACFLKKLPDEPQDWLALANSIRRLQLPQLRGAWWYCVDQVPVDWRLFGPESLGDGCFNVDDPMPEMLTFVHKQRVWNRDREKWEVVKTTQRSPGYRVKTPVNRYFDLGLHWKPRVAVAAATLGVPSRVTGRGLTVGYRTSKVLAYGRNDLWDWVGHP